MIFHNKYLIFLSVLSFEQLSFAATYPKQVTSAAVYDVAITPTRSIVCLKNSKGAIAGSVRKRSGKLYFTDLRTSWDDKITKYRKSKASSAKAALAELLQSLKQRTLLCRVDRRKVLITSSDALSYEDAAHLYRRAGFGGTKAELNFAVQTGLKATVNRLLNPIQNPALDLESARLLDGEPFTDINQLTPLGIHLSYLNEALKSQNQLQEKLVFFLE